MCAKSFLLAAKSDGRRREKFRAGNQRRRRKFISDCFHTFSYPQAQKGCGFKTRSTCVFPACRRCQGGGGETPPWSPMVSVCTTAEEEEAAQVLRAPPSLPEQLEAARAPA